MHLRFLHRILSGALPALAAALTPVALALALAACSSGGAARSCFTDADCAANKVCDPNGRCVDGVRRPVDGGAVDGGHADAGIGDGGGSDGGGSDGGSNVCDTDADCGAPANICVSHRCVAGCATTGCGSGRACDTATGRCGSCNNDADCGRPQSICDNGSCIPGCGVAGCALRNATCNVNTGRCTSCQDDAACNPPTTICVEGGCIAGCATSGCTGGQSCNQGTGRCAAPTDAGTPGNGSLGSDCQQDSDCQVGVCLKLSVAGTPYGICTKLCCNETDCPPRDSGGHGVGCIEFYGANFCLTDRIFASAGVKLERSVNQPCGPTAGDNWCRSGLCRTNSSNQQVCQSTCCRDADCGALTCAFRPGYSPGEIAHHVCELNLQGGGNGDPCQSELECAAYMCIPLGNQPFCGGTCCSARDCPSGWICTQIESGQTGYSNLGMVCVPHGGGNGATGSNCTTGTYPNECASGLCVSGVCRDPCCVDRDCPVGTVCRALDNGEPLSGQSRNGLAKVCVTQ